MKKITAFIMTVLLCVSMWGMTVSAEGEPNITVSSATAAQGDEVTITVDIANNPGIAMLELPISYDTSRLEKVSFTAEGLPGGYVNTTGVWINAGNSDYNGTILTLVFKVLENAPLGEASVDVSVKNAANWDEQSVSFDVTCGAVTVTKPVHEHTYGEWVVEKAATCTEDGSRYRTCTVADCEEKQTEVIVAPGHAMGDWTVTTPATHTETGSRTRECGNCPYSETETILAIGHYYNMVHYDETYHWYVCACGDSTDAEKHSFGDGDVCSCGYRKPVSSNPTLDKVPQTGDITPVVTALQVGTIAMIVCVAITVIFVCRRRSTR